MIKCSAIDHAVLHRWSDRGIKMAKRTIRLRDDEILRKHCKVVKEITPAILTLMDDMAETMYAADGVGLAAPQVGVLKRIVVIDVGDGLLEMINPEIIEREGYQTGEEGCLSLPGACAEVTRPFYVKARAMNRDGEIFEVEGEELLARAICHELDHLDGILYIDRANDGTYYEANEDDE